MKDSIFGSLLNAACGDAMSIAAETKTTEALVKENAGYIRSVLPCPPDGISCGVGHPQFGFGADFSSAYYVASAILDAGSVTADSIKSGLLAWADDPLYFKFVGPNSKKGIQKLQGTVFPVDKQDTVACFNRGASNGAAMRSGILGLMEQEEDCLLENVCTLCAPTHNNVIAIAAANGIAQGVAAAMQENVSVFDVIHAAKTGVQKGKWIAKNTPGVRPTAGPSLARRIDLAVKIGLRYRGNFDTALLELRDMIGSTIYAVDTVPAALGILAATTNGFDAVTMAVNMGDDCTVAPIVGFLSGALYGPDPHFIPWLSDIEAVNHVHLHEMADRIKGGTDK